jgi:rod shape-determining protein MreD
MRRTFILLFTHAVLWLVVGQLNDSLSSVRVTLFAGSLLVVLAALTQPLGAGFAAVFLTGLLCDSAQPLWVDFDPEARWGFAAAVVYGLAHANTLLLSATHAVLFYLRDRLPRDRPVGLLVVALLANLAMFLLFSLVQIAHSPAPAAMWLRLAVDLTCSQVFLALIGPWFFALQVRALALARVEREHFA